MNKRAESGSCGTPFGKMSQSCKVVRLKRGNLLCFLSSNSKCDTTCPDGLRCCQANNLLYASECRRT